MQENDDRYVKCYRYAPRRRSVRRVYFGRIAALICAVCFLACVFILIFAPRRKEYFDIKSNEYYFVQTLSTEFSAVAAEEAFGLKQSGAAGYILNDGEFRVMAAVYLSESDAQVISKRLESSGVFAVSVTFATERSRFVSTGDKSLDAAAVEFFSFPKTVVAALAELSEDYDASEISDSLAIAETEKLRNKIRAKLDRASELSSDIASVVKLMYSRFDEAFVRCTDAFGNGNIRYAVKELACAIAAENVMATRLNK